MKIAKQETVSEKIVEDTFEREKKKMNSECLQNKEMNLIDKERKKC